jgi:regulatory protein RepA
METLKKAAADKRRAANDGDTKHAKANSLPELVPVTVERLISARLTPRVIVEDYLFSDVRIRVAAGGTGKTTLALHEAMLLALGRDIWGHKPTSAGKTLIVTKEDREETLLARLYKIIQANDLTEDEARQVIENVMIYDLTTEHFRLSCIIRDVVEVNDAAIEDFIGRVSAFNPDWVIFDPLVSYGVGESRVNDAEQNLIEAFRSVIRQLDCCTEGIHHTGKVNAANKEQGQYAGRGGSALADGSRMVAVINPVEPAEWNKVCSTPLRDGETGIVQTLPKMSYCKQQDPIYIRRRGFKFEHEIVVKMSKEQVDESFQNQVYQFIVDQYNMSPSVRYSKTELVSMHKKLGISRDDLREITTVLSKSHRVIYHEAQKGKSGAYFEPIEGKIERNETNETNQEEN